MSPTGLAVLAALFVGFASAAQHHATRQVDDHVALHPGLALALLRRRWWLVGAAAVVGIGLQVAALTAGSIIAVQTVMVSSLAWTTIGESLLARRRPGARMVAGVVLLSQSALQKGHRAAPAVAVILLVDPVVGLATGVLWFGERITATAGTVLGALACVAVTVGGIALAQAAGHDGGSPRGCAPRGGRRVGRPRPRSGRRSAPRPLNGRGDRRAGLARRRRAVAHLPACAPRTTAPRGTRVVTPCAGCTGCAPSAAPCRARTSRVGAGAAGPHSSTPVPSPATGAGRPGCPDPRRRRPRSAGVPRREGAAGWPYCHRVPAEPPCCHLPGPPRSPAAPGPARVPRA